MSAKTLQNLHIHCQQHIHNISRIISFTGSSPLFAFINTQQRHASRPHELFSSIVLVWRMKLRYYLIISPTALYDVFWYIISKVCLNRCIY